MTPGPNAERAIAAQNSSTKKKPTHADSTHTCPVKEFFSESSRIIIVNMNIKLRAPTNMTNESTFML
jgi:hypothetical protein